MVLALKTINLVKGLFVKFDVAPSPRETAALPLIYATKKALAYGAHSTTSNA